MLDVPESMHCVQLCLLQALDVLEVPEVMRCVLEAGEDGLCLPEVIRCKLEADVGHRESVCNKVVRKLAGEPEQRRNNAKIFSILRHEHLEAKRAGPQV